MYKNGEGIRKDLNETLRLYKLSAEQEHSNAQYNLALMYENGEGVTRDLNESLRLYKLSADKGNSFAIKKLSLI